MSQLLVLPTPTISAHQNFPFEPIIGSSSSKTINSLKAFRSNENEELPKGFEPGPFDVICSQGKTAKSHPGNVYFQSVIIKRAKEYASAIEKRNKSKIVRNIIETIQAKSPHGGFVKKDGDDRWRVVSLDQAREKVSQSLRDTLAGRYRSSLKAKKKSRMESNLKRMIDFDEIIGTNKFVTERMQLLSKTIKNSNQPNNINTISDSKILKHMTDTNFTILRQLKRDHVVQQQVAGKTECKTSLSPSYSAVDEAIQNFHSDRGFMM